MMLIKTIELFAGVGGFRIGLEKASTRDIRFRVIWSNQWEPGRRKQIASEIYTHRFGPLAPDEHSNIDIARVHSKDIPDHDLLVGGFPCQDYSVARPLNQAHGIVGKKGVLWWEIHRILEQRKFKPQFLMLENVDRLLKSPANQRGRDFAIMLGSLADLGYIVEWRVINAADYGMPQRRRRVFILGYLKDSRLNKRIKKTDEPLDWVLRLGTMARAFPAKSVQYPGRLFTHPNRIEGNLFKISESFNLSAPHISPFQNSGIMIDRKYWTLDLLPKYKGKSKTLGSALQKDSSVPESFFIKDKDLKRWEYLKGAKDEERYNKKGGFYYRYNEGAIPFPDRLDQPSRTIITSEGGSSPSRFKHVVLSEGRYRRLTPVELERLNMFPQNHTKGTPDKEYSDIERAFLMGNALVVGVIERLGRALVRSIQE